MSLLAVAVACLGLGFAFGKLSGAGPADGHPPQRASSNDEARRANRAARSAADFPPRSIDSPAAPGSGATIDSSDRPPDVRSLAACAGGAQSKAAERCWQRLDTIGIQDPLVRTTFLQLISTQQDPAAKARIFENITPAPLSPEDLAPFLKQLELLRASSDPEVRADGLIRTAAWDRSDAVAGVLRQGLYDPDPEVARAAATAVLVSNARTQDIKAALLALATDATPESQLHRSALEALRDFSLSREEYLIYRAAQDRADTESQR